jgi:hypothetical protein
MDVAEARAETLRQTPVNVVLTVWLVGGLCSGLPCRVAVFD